MESKTIKKYFTRSIPWLRKKAGETFRAYVRKRDEGQPCISCGSYSASQAGHYYSAGHYPALEFDPVNVNCQCIRCNMYLSGNLINYRFGLERKWGESEVKKLDERAAYYKRHGYKHDRFNLIEIIEKYK